jgi:hypothetical protein
MTGIGAVQICAAFGCLRRLLPRRAPSEVPPFEGVVGMACFCRGHPGHGGLDALWPAPHAYHAKQGVQAEAAKPRVSPRN